MLPCQGRPAKSGRNALVRLPPDVGAEALELPLELLVAPVEMVDPVYRRLAAGGELGAPLGSDTTLDDPPNR